MVKFDMEVEVLMFDYMLITGMFFIFVALVLGGLAMTLVLSMLIWETITEMHKKIKKS